MTLRQINDCLREEEIEELEPAKTRLVAAIAILRRIDRGAVATDDECAASMNEFRRSYGEITTDSVDKFMELGDTLLDAQLDNDWILEALK